MGFNSAFKGLNTSAHTAPCLERECPPNVSWFA